MLLDQPGQIFHCENTPFPYSVGQEIVANANSGYAGLTGAITEIRDGDDKETDNPSADIYCTFSMPNTVTFAEELERRFSMPVGEIPYDMVSMAPEMLEPKMKFQITPMHMLVRKYHIDSNDC